MMTHEEYEARREEWLAQSRSRRADAARALAYLLCATIAVFPLLWASVR
jgi:hypothetical protein